MSASRAALAAALVSLAFAAVRATVISSTRVESSSKSSSSSSSSFCSFCGIDEKGLSHTFDLSAVSSTTFNLNDGYYATSPCGTAISSAMCVPPSPDPTLQECRGLGSLAGNNASVQLVPSVGFNITMHGGSSNPPCGSAGYRTLVYEFICDKSVAVTNPPEPNVTEYVDIIFCKMTKGSIFARLATRRWWKMWAAIIDHWVFGCVCEQISRVHVYCPMATPRCM